MRLPTDRYRRNKKMVILIEIMIPRRVLSNKSDKVKRSAKKRLTKKSGIAPERRGSVK
jgi:hypothetical protein